LFKTIFVDLQDQFLIEFLTIWYDLYLDGQNKKIYLTKMQNWMDKRFASKKPSSAIFSVKHIDAKYGLFKILSLIDFIANRINTTISTFFLNVKQKKWNIYLKKKIFPEKIHFLIQNRDNPEFENKFVSLANMYEVPIYSELLLQNFIQQVKVVKTSPSLFYDDYNITKTLYRFVFIVASIKIIAQVLYGDIL